MLYLFFFSFFNILLIFLKVSVSFLVDDNNINGLILFFSFFFLFSFGKFSLSIYIYGDSVSVDKQRNKQRNIQISELKKKKKTLEMSTPVQQSMARLRTKMLFAAKLFPDYNFRSYFVRHVREQFAAMERWSVEEQQQFLRKEGSKQLNEMRRMAITNRMYASQPVFLDKRGTHHLAQAEKK
ncbi:uncharacterized protein TM35_000083950 [Trypanosoma theileri]|uniref:Complex 1 LYR protein domain-containing protein n=1 Tax=Trypanosoma theileri TaxID=67003 RepID=A0A1X0P0Z1_9TRYP|nr:uncharacterized protein TM35_000083950 [Trypanosoma theileri]ORC90597.1 hypothetical protein TM35_000083950 [Trypanosoma theileri]